MPTINKLPLLDTISGGDQLPVYSPNAGDARRMSINSLADYIEDNVIVPNNAANVTYDPAGTGAVSRTVQAKLRDVVSVKDFGAVGDGVADDFVAINNALNAAIAGGKGLLFPPGAYKHSGVLNFGSQRLRVKGDGLVRLQYTGTATAGVTVASTNGFIYDIIIEDLWIEGNGNTIGIFVQNSAHCVFKNIRIGNVDTYGIYIEGSVLDTWENAVVSLHDQPYFPGIWTAFPKYGIYLISSEIATQATANTFINPIIEDVSEVGIYLKDAANNTFIGGTSEGNTGTGGTWNGVGIVIQANSPGNAFINTFCEYNKSGDLICYGKNNEFRNCTFSSLSLTVPYEAVKSISIESGAEQNRIVGSYFYAGEVKAGAVANSFEYCDSAYKVNDAGTRTQILWTRQAFNTSNIVPGIKAGNLASSDAEVLDWYQEGTFSPAFGGSVSDGSVSYDIQEGKYTRIGDTVSFNMLLRVTTVSSSPSGNLLVKGLPFASSAVPGQHAVSVGACDSLTLPTSRVYLTAYVLGGESVIRLAGNASGLASALVQGSGLAATLISLSGSYKV